MLAGNPAHHTESEADARLLYHGTDHRRGRPGLRYLRPLRRSVALMHINPAWLSEVGATAPVAGFAVYAATYPKADGKRDALQTFQHRTLKTAFRTLGSICNRRGKLYRANVAAAFIMLPDGQILSWNETKAMLAKMESL